MIKKALALAVIATNAQAVTIKYDAYGQTAGFDNVDAGVGVPLKVRFVDGALIDAYGYETTGAILAYTISAGVWSSDILHFVNVVGGAWLHRQITWQDSAYIAGCWDNCMIRALKKTYLNGGGGVTASWDIVNAQGVNQLHLYNGFAAFTDFNSSTVGINQTNAVWGAM